MTGFKWGAACLILFSQAPDCALGSTKPELAAAVARNSLFGLVAVPRALAAIPAACSGARAALQLAVLLASPSAWRAAPLLLAAATVWLLRGGSRHVMPLKAPQGSEVRPSRRARAPTATTVVAPAPRFWLRRSV
jgi:hypothetical protein